MFVYAEPKLQIIRDELDDTLKKIERLETAISKSRQQYDQLTKELKELLDKQKVLQSEKLMKAVADSSQSYEDILRYIKGETSEDEGSN